MTRTKSLGTGRMARSLGHALPGSDRSLHVSIWDFMRPMLSPALTRLNRDMFISDEHNETTVDLDAHRAGSDLDHLDLGDDVATTKSV